MTPKRMSATYLEGHGFDSYRGLRFFSLSRACGMLISSPIHHLYSLINIKYTGINYPHLSLKIPYKTAEIKNFITFTFGSGVLD